MSEWSRVARLTSVQAVGFHTGEAGIKIVINDNQHMTMILDEQTLAGMRQALDEVEAMLKHS